MFSIEWKEMRVDTIRTMNADDHVLRVAEKFDEYRSGNRTWFVSSSFQTHSIPLLHLLSRVAPETPVYFLDTGFHFPETRKFFFARYFYDDVQAYLCIALVSIAATPFLPLAVIGLIPYAIKRGSEQTRAMRGILRPLRAVLYFPRDVLTFFCLLRGSIRHRSLLL